jgi:hypothetical protein
MTHCLACLMLILVPLAARTVAAAPDAPDAAAQRTQDFSTDPKWDGHRNRLVPNPAPLARQSFGYQKDTRRAGGKEGGEIGGWVERAVRRAAYAKAIPEKTLNDKLSASGTFAVTHEEGSSGTMFGWFNDKTSIGWRTPDSLTFRIDGNGGKYWVFFEYGTRSSFTAGGGTFEGPRYQTTKTKPFPADGTVHTWKLAYDPTGHNGEGEMTFTLDGTDYPLPLRPEHKADGATFNRFGLFNQQTNGARMEVFFDDVVLEGDAQDFSKDPQWWAQGNKEEYEDRDIRPLHDFGFSKTSFAGGKEGEIGGIIWRDEAPAYYGDRIGPLTLNEELYAAGRLAFTAGGSDSGAYFGWFNAASKREKDKPEDKAPQRDVLAIIVEGPSRVGHYFRPTYRTSAGEGRTPDTGPLIRPDGKVHDWSIRYSPKGDGRITVTFDGHEQTLDLRPGDKTSGATFDRFGFFNHQSGGSHVKLYVDDLTYTAKPNAPRAP